jgi:hypothetical protein
MLAQVMADLVPIESHVTPDSNAFDPKKQLTDDHLLPKRPGISSFPREVIRCVRRDGSNTNHGLVYLVKYSTRRPLSIEVETVDGVSGQGLVKVVSQQVRSSFTGLAGSLA